MHLPHDTLLPFIGLAFVLGLRHGMDADHLAMIDGLTRFNLAAGRGRLARFCGFLFSLGHGAVVCVVAVTAGLLFGHAALPDWLDGVGAWISIAFLLLLGLLNLHAVLSTPAHEMVTPLGLKGRWLGGLNRAGHPALVALVGALFAISFDTLSQAALFSVASTHYGGVFYALLLALTFMLGMMTTDALNGLWISKLLRRADATALLVSRIMGFTVATLSLGVAGLGMSSRFLPQAAAWQQRSELFIGLAVLAAVAGSFLFALRLQRRISATG